MLHKLRAPKDIARAPLLHINDRRDWAKWLHTCDVAAADAAVDGQGVALARTAHAANDLISGRLVRPFETALQMNYAYYIVCPRALAEHPKVAAFREWLTGEAAGAPDGWRIDHFRTRLGTPVHHSKAVMRWTGP